MMGFAEFAKIRCAGPVIGLALGSRSRRIAYTDARTDATVWSLRILAVAASRATVGHVWADRIWDWISRRVVARPGWVLGGAAGCALRRSP